MERRRKETKEWEPWFIWLPDGHTVRCVFCGNTMQYRRERAFSHYGWQAKSTRGICTKAPRPVKANFLECSGRIPAHMEPNKMYGQDGEANVPTLSQSTPTNGSIANVTSIEPSSLIRGTSSTEPSRVASYTVRSRSMRQQDLDEVYQLNKRKELDEKWLSFFYNANVPFNVGRHPTFVEAVNATALAGFNYKPPSYNALRTTLIESKCRSTKTQVNPNSALNRTKHYQSNPSNVLGILDSNLSKRACVYTSKSLITWSNRIPSL